MDTTDWRHEPTLALDHLGELTLKKGAHGARDNGLCAMEAAAWMAGEAHSDHPACVSPVIASFMRNWNDDLPSDEDRDRLLKPLLPLTLNTRTNDADEERRGLLCADWLMRTFTPAWLDAAKLSEEAAELRALPELVDTAAIAAAQPILNRARERAAAAWDAAWAAAWAAAGDAAWDAAWAAAWAAAGDAAWDAAWAAARAAAWAAAGDAAWAAARAAAWAAAWAARAAARAAAWAAAGDAARAAANDRLAPVVKELQESASELVRRMCTVDREA